MATIKAGTYRFNDEPTFLSTTVGTQVSLSIPFTVETSNGVTECSMLGFIVSSNGNTITVLHDDTPENIYISTNGWLIDSRVFTVSADTDVEDETAFAWFTENTQMLIEAGTYRWNDTLTSGADVPDANITFTYPLVTINESDVSASISTELYTAKSISPYLNIGGIGVMTYNENPNIEGESVTLHDAAYWYNDSGWAGIYDNIISQGGTAPEELKTVYQIITITEDTYVPVDFGTWFTANTSTTMTLSGIWLFNETLEVTDSQNVSLLFNAKSCQHITQMGITKYTSTDTETGETSVTMQLVYFQTAEDILGEYTNQYTVYSTFSGWGSYPRRVELTSEQEVPVAFYEWFTTNAIDITNNVTQVNYDGTRIAALQDGESVMIDCAKQEMSSAISITARRPTVLTAKEITANGEYPASVDNADGFSNVTVNVPIPEGYIQPSGTLSITANNRLYDVKEYQYAQVNVPADGSAPTTEEITVTPSESEQVIIPTTADYISKITVEPISEEYIIPTGSTTITENDTGIDVSQYSTVDVAVPPPEGYLLPAGMITITENGSGIDVSQYAYASVGIPLAELIQARYWTLQDTLDFSMIPNSLLGGVHYIFFELPDSDLGVGAYYVGLRISNGELKAIPKDDYMSEVTLYDANGWVDAGYKNIHCTAAVISEVLYKFLGTNYSDLISFSIGTATYQVNPGTTWGEWLNTTNGDLAVSGDNVWPTSAPSGYIVRTSDGTAVLLTDEIIAGHSYIVQ